MFSKIMVIIKKYFYTGLIVLWSIFLIVSFTLGVFILKQVRINKYLNIANAYRISGNYTMTIKTLEKAANIHPRSDLIFSALAEAYYFLTGNTDKAIENYKIAIKLNSNSEYYYYLGEIYYDEGNLNEAIQNYQKTIELDPQGADNAYLGIGNAMFDQGKLSESKKYYEQAIGINQFNANAYNDLGVYYEKIGDINSAIKEYEKALEIDSDHALALENLNRAKAALKSLPKE